MSALPSFPALASREAFLADAGPSIPPYGAQVSLEALAHPAVRPYPMHEARGVHSVGGPAFEVSIVRPALRGRGGNRDLAPSSAAPGMQNHFEVLGEAERGLPVHSPITAGEEPGITTQWNQFATRANGRYLLFLRPGIVPWPGALERLLAFAHAHPEFSAIGARVVTAQGVPWAMAEGLCSPNRSNQALTELRRSMANALNRRTLPALGAGALLIRAEVFRELTGFDPRLGSDAAALDVLLELLARGHAVGLCAAASFVCATPVTNPWNLRQDALRLRRRWGVHHLTDVDALWDAAVATRPQGG